MGSYLAFIAAMYRVSKPQRPYLGHVIGLGVPLLSPPSGSCLGTLFRGVLIGLKFGMPRLLAQINIKCVILRSSTPFIEPLTATFGGLR